LNLGQKVGMFSHTLINLLRITLRSIYYYPLCKCAFVDHGGFFHPTGSLVLPWLIVAFASGCYDVIVLIASLHSTLARFLRQFSLTSLCSLDWGWVIAITHSFFLVPLECSICAVGSINILYPSSLVRSHRCEIEDFSRCIVCLLCLLPVFDEVSFVTHHHPVSRG
jgi:hypothetical protein